MNNRETWELTYRTVRCTHYDPAETGPRRTHWHIERDGDRLDLRFDTRAEAMAEAERLAEEGHGRMSA